MSFVVSVLMLVAGDVARAIHEVLPASDALAPAGAVESLLVRPGVFARVCEAVYGGCGCLRLCYLQVGRNFISGLSSDKH